MKQAQSEVLLLGRILSSLMSYKNDVMRTANF